MTVKETILRLRNKKKSSLRYRPEKMDYIWNIVQNKESSGVLSYCKGAGRSRETIND